MGPQPSSAGSAEKPYPGIDGSTRWNASPAVPPCAAGSVSGPTIPSSSITEPGQPCVMINGSAFSCRDLTWMKWTSTPSISVVNIGSAFSFASHAPVVLGRPVAGELLDRGQLHALRPVCDQLLGGPAGRGDAWSWAAWLSPPGSGRSIPSALLPRRRPRGSRGCRIVRNAARSVGSTALCRMGKFSQVRRQGLEPRTRGLRA
jgi:hypothetical protein